MEKILIAIDSRNLDQEAVRFACHLARLTGSKLTAVFLEDRHAERKAAFQAIAMPGLEATLTLMEATLEHDSLPAVREKNIALFNRLSAEEGIRATIYLDKGVPVEDIIAESLFADVLIVDGGMFSAVSDEPPTGFVKAIIHDAGCPVIVAPETFSRIDNIVFCYDGGRSSLLAMKQFAHLFPQLGAQRAKVIDMRDEFTTPGEEGRMTEWLRTHFASVEWLARGTKASAVLFSYLVEKADDFIIMGAYGKGLLASFFTQDPELGITRTTRLPIFVAHY